LIEASNATDRLIKLDPRNAAGHVIRGSMLRAVGEVDKAIASLEYALALNPNFNAAHAELGLAKIDAGLAHQSIGHIEVALQLTPPEPLLYFFAGYAALHISDDLAAVKWFLKARQANPASTNTALWLAAAYLGTGEEQAARASLAEYLKEKPRFSIEGFKRFVPITNPVVAKQRERIMDAWRRLGVPETPPSEQASQ
jgi:tetratricopeptide (TPR) repeat protein